MANKSVKVPERSFRSAAIERAEAGEEDRIIELSFSSEEPYERWWGVEILGHGKSEVDLSFIGSGRAPFLVDHKRSVDNQIGVVEKVWLDSGTGRARIRFGKAARATEFLERVRDGELSNISVGYSISELRLESETDGIGTYRITRWKPEEISLVTVPADETVGVGRSADEKVKQLSLTKDANMENDELETVTEPATNRAASTAATPANPAGAKPINREDVLRIERERISEIQAIGEKHNMADKARDAIKSGASVAMFRGVVLDALGDAASEKMAAAGKVGLTEKEAKSFSFMRAIRAMANPTDRRAQEDARFEFEVSVAAQQALGKGAKGVLIPNDVLLLQSPEHARARAQMQEQRAALAYGTAAAAGRLVQTELDSSSFIDVLRNKMMVRQLGARVLNDLVGDLDIPRKSSASSATWVSAEAGNATETVPNFDLVQFRLKSLGGYTDITRKMLNQSSLDIEMLVRDDLSEAIALGVDAAALHGSGSSGQPTGIAGVAGIGAVVGGTNGLAPTWAHVVGLETEVAVDNADIGTLAYLTNPKVRGKLKTTEKASSTAQFVWREGPELNGYRAEVTNQVSSTLTKGSSSGVCSAIFYGNWADLMIAFWSGVDLLVDPYTLGLSGGLRVRALQDCDVQVRRAQSFAAMLDALTT
jgi:HK97 family phage major capsid protein/HK97 family phage prohead protease